MIAIAGPIIEDDEIKAVNDVLASGIIAQGPRVAELEERFAAYCGTKYAVALNSGTAAIHTALHIAGVTDGDEVITTPFSFIATINPIIMCGAKPVLADIDPTTFNIDINNIEKLVTKKTKAIVAVDLYGQPCDWDGLRDIAKKNQLILIEDSCQSIGAEYKGKKTGSLGDIGCFSLYATKNIMCGEGGMITTDNEGYYHAAKRFRQHGMSGPYEYSGLGYNYRMTDLQAAIAIEQLKKVDKFNSKRNDNAKLLSEGLSNIKGIVLPILIPDRTHAYHQFTVRVTSDFPMTRAEFVDFLNKNQIGAGVYYPKPLHAYDHVSKFGYEIGDFPVAEQASSEVVSLPVHSMVSKDDIAQIINVIKEASNE